MRTITLRHSWPENVDASVWDGISRAARKLAQVTADNCGHVVELYAKPGYLLDEYEPQENYE